MVNILRYLHTIKHFTLLQAIAQLQFRFKKMVRFKNKSYTHYSKKVNLKRRECTKNLVMPIKKNSCNLVSAQTMMILNQAVDIQKPSAWSRGSSLLSLYHLHYFDVLHSLDTIAGTTLIERWTNENPCGSKPAWDAYPTSQRLVNWIKWILLIEQQNKAEKINNLHHIVYSIFVQARYLNKNLEKHILANHLFANAKALLIAGLFFDCQEADHWVRKAMHLLHMQIKEQILADGGHYELTPMYHSIILEDMLDIINFLKCYAKKIPEEWFVVVGKMLHWLKVMSHPDQEISFFNDTTLNISANWQTLHAYRERLNFSTTTSFLSAMTYLQNSGYCRLENNIAVLLVDVAEVGVAYQPGHAHADSLSFELSLHKKRIMVNSGISTYADGDARSYQRATQAHNTLVVDSLNSSDVWKSFRVGRRAKIKNIKIAEEEEYAFLEASHTGYQWHDRIIHTRQFKLYDQLLEINDLVSGKGMHHIEIFFHFHPELHLRIENHQLLIESEHGEYFLKSNAPLRIEKSSYYPGFNQQRANSKAVITMLCQLPYSFHSEIYWG